MELDWHETTNLAVEAATNTTVAKTMADLHSKLRTALSEG
jgi:hypothetical protein